MGLAVKGGIGRDLALGAIGAAVEAAVNGVLRPMLLRGESEMSGLVLLVSMLGGVVAFGMVGLVAGPVIMWATIALLGTFSSPSESACRLAQSANQPVSGDVPELLRTP